VWVVLGGTGGNGGWMAGGLGGWERSERSRTELSAVVWPLGLCHFRLAEV